MVDPGERVSVTVKREFMEEALDSTGAAKGEIEQLAAMVDKFFDGGEEVYRSRQEGSSIMVAYEEHCRGYVDDPRNTDNAWMETVAFSFHDPTGQEVAPQPSNPKPPISGRAAAAAGRGRRGCDPVDAAQWRGG
jgi:ADP-ribose pyrophosphatase